ncbi:dTDP-4-dehydrorhamnose 3,5-epimerase [Leeia aquatica]|uniref:dTDP-4-dehydrorhamnose 3,5-epimerase n=1 Tax=Leeia aquatica TaxID=2725557 RepID=A0A847SB84_9NEIS|nr:dTDP-4-dehydrorhamnose 3,5-epimerase [Leeia aquatica]NLR74599.1 dTDP-4-dehydrorhamnose 3,5-epimerase [Leeia aquatica]
MRNLLTASATPLAGLLVLETVPQQAAASVETVTFRADAFQQWTNMSADFVLEGHSRSCKHVVRGLHYQAGEHAQGKLVRVVQGAVWDVAVDLRRHSATFGQWYATTLSADNGRQLWIPPGFAHGFCALADQVDMLYKLTAYRHAESERCIHWQDPDLAIPWPLSDREARLSERDAAAGGFRQAAYYD